MKTLEKWAERNFFTKAFANWRIFVILQAHLFTTTWLSKAGNLCKFVSVVVAERSPTLLATLKSFFSMRRQRNFGHQWSLVNFYPGHASYKFTALTIKPWLPNPPPPFKTFCKLFDHQYPILCVSTKNKHLNNTKVFTCRMTRCFSDEVWELIKRLST